MNTSYVLCLNNSTYYLLFGRHDYIPLTVNTLRPGTGRLVQPSGQAGDVERRFGAVVCEEEVTRLADIGHILAKLPWVC